MASYKTNILANFFGQAWSNVINLILVPFYIQYLGVELFGLLAFFISIQALISILDLGLGITANREIAKLSVQEVSANKSRCLLRTLEIIYYAVAIIIALSVLVLSAWISVEWFKPGKIPVKTIQSAIVIFGVILAVRWPISLYSGVLRGLQKQVILNFITGAIATLKGIGSLIILIYISRSIIDFLFWHLFVAIIEILIMSITSWKELPPVEGLKSKFVPYEITKLWQFTAGVGAISILAAIIKQIDKMIVSKLLPLENLGYYNTASSATLAIYLFCIPVTQAGLPKLSALIAAGNEKELANIYHQSSQLIAFFVSPIASILIIFPHDILFWWTRSEVVANNSCTVLSILAFASLLNAMMQLPYMLQLSAGITKIALLNNAVAIIVLIPLIYISISYKGILGGAIAWAIFNAWYFLAIPALMHRYVLQGHYKQWLFKDTLPFMIIGLFVFTSAWLFSLLVTELILKILVIFLSLAIYLFITYCAFKNIRKIINITIASRRIIPRKVI